MNKNSSKSNLLTLEDMRDMLKSKINHENCYDNSKFEDDLENVKVDQIKVDSFYEFQKQRNKNFNFKCGATQNSNKQSMRDMCEKRVFSQEIESNSPIDNASPGKIECRSEQDFEKVNEYLSSSKKKYMICAIILTLLFLISSVWHLGIFTHFHLPPSLTSANPTSYIFLNFWILLAATIPFLHILHLGLSSLLELKPNSDSVVCVMLLGNICQVVLLFFSRTEMIINKNVFVLTPVVIGSMAFHCVSKYINFVAMLSNFRFICNTDKKDCAVLTVDRGGFMSAFRSETENHIPMVIYKRRTNFFTNFMYYPCFENITDKIGYFSTIIGFCLSVFLFLISAIISKNIWSALTAFASSLCLITPFCFLFSIVLPFVMSQKNLHENKAAFLGFDAAKCGKTDAIIIQAKELFPKGTVNLSGIRIFNGHQIDDSIICAASIFNATNGILKDMFMGIILENKNCLKKVENILYEDGLGISAQIGARQVIIGNYCMMVNNRIEMPVEMKKFNKNGHDYVFIAISGKLTAAFMYNISTNFKIKANLSALEKEEIFVVVQTTDFVIKPKKLSKIFQIPENLFKILPAWYHKSYQKQTRSVQKDGSTIISDDSFTSFSNAIIESKKFLTHLKIGIVTYILETVVSILGLTWLVSVDMIYKFSPMTIVLFKLSILLCVILINIFIKFGLFNK